MIKQNKTIGDYWENKNTISLVDKNLRILETNFILKNILKSDKLLDLGCGDGESTFHYAKKVKKLIAFEKSNYLFKKMKKRVGNKGKVTFINDSLVNLNEYNFYCNKIVTQRVVINFMTWNDQKQIINLIHKKLPKNGKYLMIENTMEGFQSMNRLRNSLGLESIKIHKWHNKFFYFKDLLKFVDKKFKIEEINNFNLYYFLTRAFVNTFANFSGYGNKIRKDKIFEITDYKSRILHEKFNEKLNFKDNKYNLFGPISGFVLKKI